MGFSPSGLVHLRRITVGITLVVAVNILLLILQQTFLKFPPLIRGVQLSTSTAVSAQLLPEHDSRDSIFMNTLNEPQVPIKEIDVYMPSNINEFSIKSKQTGTVNGKILKKILVWNDYWKSQALWHKIFHQIIHDKCPQSTCLLTNDKTQLKSSDAILFHILDLHKDKYRVPQFRDPKQIWIAMTFEPPYILNYAGVDLPRLNGVFNRTMTYRRDADIVVRHGIFRPIKEQRKIPNFMSNWIGSHDDIKHRDYAKGKRRLVAWFASSRGCRSQSNRETYVQQLQHYIPVDIYGACGPYKCGTQKTIRNPYNVEHDDCYLLVSVGYKFVLAFENSVCDDYVTEKLYNHLKLNVVPVVFGGSNYTYYAPPHSVIDASQFSPKELADYLLFLDGNDPSYNEYFAWKKDYYVEAHDGIPLICDLCDKLNLPEWEREKKTYNHLDTWFDNSCHPPYPGDESISYAQYLTQIRNKTHGLPPTSSNIGHDSP